MFHFDRPVWALLNTRTGKLFAPLKINMCTFRGLYDSLKAANAGARMLNKRVAELDDGSIEDKEVLNRLYDFDVDSIKGQYIPIQIKLVEAKKYEEVI